MNMVESFLSEAQQHPGVPCEALKFQWRTQKGGGVWGFSPQKNFEFSGLKTHGFFKFRGTLPNVFLSMVDATSSDRTILSLPPVVIAQP